MEMEKDEQMKKKLWKKFFILLVTAILIWFLFNGCMMLGMAAHHGMRGSISGNYSGIVGKMNTGDKIDELLDEIVNDPSLKKLPVSTVAIWQIRSKTAGIDVEMIRQKLIARLLEQKKFKIVARDRLQAILAEHNLSISGIIDDQSAVEIGKLVGVEGFIDGYVSISENKLVLSLNIVETKTGTIIWAKTVKE